jgi:MinD-like ATPase involved in chromosome partitioning or flagellar assembly
VTSFGTVGGSDPSGIPLRFSSQGQTVVEVPFDGHLRPGGVIDHTSQMSAPTRRRFVEIAAALAKHFPTRDDRSRERF